MNWKPTASLDNLRKRAQIIAKIRDFFNKKAVLEVETPILGSASVPDLYIESFETVYKSNTEERKLYMQTSPEFAMKRLLAAGYGAIFQIFRSFRNGEFGDRHNPEFTMLEWYQPKYDHNMLIDEVDVFLQHVISTKPANKISYQDLFISFLKINPHLCDKNDLWLILEKKEILPNQNINNFSRTDLLDLLFSHFIEPNIAQHEPLAVYDFPKEQAALARIEINDKGVKLAKRFEFYFKGYEIANGYFELDCAKEQLERFKLDLKARREKGLAEPAIDYNLIKALEAGMGKCAGVAVGVDRLVMIALNCRKIKDVVAFPLDIA